MEYKSSNKADSRIETEKQKATAWMRGMVLLSVKQMFNIKSCCLYLVVKQINSYVNSLFTFIVPYIYSNP